MTRFIEILISLAIVAALLLIVGIALPSSRHVTKQVETNRKMTIVYDTLNSFQRFKAWNVLPLRDPAMDIKLSGPLSGVGAKLDYASADRKLGVGTGSYEITASEPGKRVAYAIQNEERGSDKRTEFSFRPTGKGRNIQITQTYDVDYGWDLLGRYTGLYTRQVGDTMEMGLGRLSNMLASVPNVDYAMKGSTLTNLRMEQRPAEHLLVVNSGAVDRNNAAIKASMKGNMEWINRTMAASGLVAAGPMRVISTELGAEKYTFDIAVPVRKGSAAPADASTGANADAPTDATATASASTAPADAGSDAPLSVKLQGPVTYVQTKPTRVATGAFKGFIGELDNVRSAVRAWAITQGYDVIDRPYEVYKNGIDPAFAIGADGKTGGGDFDVYWNLK